MDDALFKELDPSVQELFTPFSQKADWRYWQLRRSRAIRRITAKRYLGAPMRIGMRWLAG